MLAQTIDRISDWGADQKIERVGSVAFYNTRTNGSKITITLKEFDFAKYDEVNIVPVQTGKLLPCFCESNWNKTEVSVDLSDLKQMVSTRKNVTFRLALAVRVKSEVTFYNLKCEDESYTSIKKIVADKRKNFFPELWEEAFEDTTIVCQGYFNERRQFMISMREKKNQYMAQVTNELTQVRFSGPFLHLKAECWDVNMTYVGFVLSYRSQLERDKVEYFVPATAEKKAEKISLLGQVDIRKVPLQMLYWDIHTVVEQNEKRFYIPMKTDHKELGRYYEQVMDHYSYKFPDGNIVFAYFTKGNSVALRYRATIPQDCMQFRIKERVAIVLQKLLKGYLQKKNIYLVYEKNSYMAQDNGFYFFKYCMEHQVGEKNNRSIYYLIDEKSPDYENVQPYLKNVIRFGSLKHMIYLKSARLLISSETKDHAYIWRSMASRLKWTLPHKKLVFLQHGVTAFKKNDFLMDEGKTDGWEMFVTTSQQEKEIISQYYPAEKIKVTGFSRWDVLEDCSGHNRQILVMPTWRNWLDDVDDETFENSEYFVRYKTFLESKQLENMLEQQNVKLIFYIHPKFRDHIQSFSGVHKDHIQFVAFGEQPLNQIMMNSKMLITDYSSVSWDMFYQGKPVIFYQFDLDDYNVTAGSYIDMKTQLFGERIETEEELLSILESYLRNGMHLKLEFAKMQKTAFAYQDKENSKRIWEAIITEVDP